MSSTKKQVPDGLKGAEIDLEDGMLRDEGVEVDSEEANRGDEDNLNLPDPQRGDALGSSPQPSANDSKMAPILLKNPPVQAMNGAAGHLPTFKDQARSIAATAATAASATRATHQSTENAASGHLPTFKDQARSMTATASASTRASNNTHEPTQEDLKDGGPDFKDQVRSGRPPPPQQQQQQQQRKSLPSAQGVRVESMDQEPQASTVVAFVLETIPGDNDNPAEHPHQLQVNEPTANDGETRVRKRLFWAAGILLVVVAVVVGVVVALVIESPEEEEPPMVFAEETKLTASVGAGGDGFGFHVAIDEDTVVVGAYQYLKGDNADGSKNNGTAFVFTRMGNTWTEQAKLMAGDGAADDYFGSSVGVSGDTVIVGAHLDDDNATNSGSAYVYTRTGTTWTEQAKLTASDGAAGDQFGFSVAIEGDIIVVGAWLDDDNGSASGTAFIFTRLGTTWTEQAKLTASDVAGGDRFGRSVAIAGDTIVVGATPETGQNGSAFVFTRTGTTWTEQDHLTSTSAPDFFGVRVAIAGDTIVVGADREDDNGTNSGTVTVYTRAGTVWTQQAKLKASDAAGDDRFGVSVAIAGDTIVVGADWDDENATNSGSVYVFTRMEGEWTEQAKLTASEGGDVEDQFGISVGIASGTIVVGAWQDDNDNGVESGSAYVYDLN